VIERAWQELILPERRFLPIDAPVSDWRISQSVEVGDDAAARTLRIGARRLAFGRVAFILFVLNDEGR